MKNIVVIPARYASVRLPAKPLAMVDGKTIIEYVYTNAAKSKIADEVIVATDDERIMDVVRGFGGLCEMTSSSHSCGTERVCEVAARANADFVINVQGDEPDIPAAILDDIFTSLSKGDAEVVTAARVLRTPAELNDPSRVKVVCNSSGLALLFSRASIPWARDEASKADAFAYARIHVGIYGFKCSTLLSYPKLSVTKLEDIEKLEQLRLLYNGVSIKVLDCVDFADSIDTPQDLARFAALVEQKKQLGGKS